MSCFADYSLTWWAIHAAIPFLVCLSGSLLFGMLILARS